MHVRDTVPPGLNLTPPARSYLESEFLDWSVDLKNNGPYESYDAAGTPAIDVPPLRPGHTYYLGFRAVGDATFSVSSSVTGGDFGTPVDVPFYDGHTTGTIGAHGTALFQVRVPDNASRWIHRATHSADVSLFIEQGTLPVPDHTADWQSWGEADSELNQYLLDEGNWPWMPGQTYYILAVNNGDSEQVFDLSVQGVASGAPENDDFADRVTLAGPTVSVSALNYNATKEPGEPDHAGYEGGRSLWWSWTAPGTGIVRLRHGGDGWWTLAGVYTGTEVSGLSLVSENVNWSGDLEFACLPGVTYQIAVDSYDGWEGALTLDLEYTAQFYIEFVTIGNGTLAPDPTGWYPLGEIVTATAWADAYHHFVEWTGDTEGDTTSDTMSVVADRDRTIIAHFQENRGPRGTPEQWLADHGLAFGNLDDDELADSDADRMLNWEEYVADTDPADDQSVLRLHTVEFTEGDVLVRWQGGVQARQILEVADDLSQPDPWRAVWTNEPPTAVDAAFRDEEQRDGGVSRFYRITVERP
jgi:hypothetical protein